MTIVQVMFYFLAFIALGSAIFVASSKSLVRSIFMFFVALFALAGLYVLALADFVAITQIVIYVGGILVLILFAFMLSGRETLAHIAERKSHFISANRVVALLLSGLFFIALAAMVSEMDADNLSWIKRSAQINNIIKPTTVITDNIGINLMTQYLLPFEAISVLLLMALVGAAHLARKERSA
jgi:NADH:ubiquinone oxidoreductase subunit 6 (subunit J)